IRTPFIRRWTILTALQSMKVLCRVVKSIGMIDAQSVDLPFPQQLKNKAVRLFEHRRVLLTKRGEIIDIEKPAVVDVVRRHSPVRQPKGLRLDQFVQVFKTVRLTWNAVEVSNDVFDKTHNLGRPRAQLCQPALVNFLVAGALSTFFRFGLLNARQMTECGDQTLQLQQFRIAAAKLPLELIYAVSQNARIFFRAHQKPMLMIGNGELAFF